MASGRLPGDFWPRAIRWMPPGAEPESAFASSSEEGAGSLYEPGSDDDVPATQPDVGTPLKRPASKVAKSKSVPAPKVQATPSVKARAKAKSVPAPKVQATPSVKARAKAKPPAKRPSTKAAAKVAPKPKVKSHAAKKSKDSGEKTSPSKAKAGDEDSADMETLPVRAGKGAAKTKKASVKKPSKMYPKPGTVGCSKCRFQGCSKCRKARDDETMTVEPEAGDSERPEGEVGGV